MSKAGLRLFIAAGLSCVAAAANPQVQRPGDTDTTPVAPPTHVIPEFLPPIETLAEPTERVILNDFLLEAARSTGTPEVVAAAADRALAHLPRPTRLRGFIQFVRAGALDSSHRELDAIDAIEESVRLLPGYSAR